MVRFYKRRQMIDEKENTDGVSCCCCIVIQITSMMIANNTHKVCQNVRESSSLFSTHILQFYQSSLPFPNTFITKIVSICHENPVKSNERTNRVVRFEGSCTMLNCQGKCQIPHPLPLLIGH